MRCPICETQILFSSKDPRVRVCHGCRSGQDSAEVLAEFIEDVLNGKQSDTEHANKSTYHHPIPLDIGA